MKPLSSTFLGSLTAALALTWCVSARAQVVITDAPTTYAGTVTQYEPVRQTLVVRQDASTAPVTYNVTQATTFVDENGSPVLAERVTSGIPITVHYVRQGDQMIASRVIVRRTMTVPTPVERTATVPAPVERTTTVTTTTSGAGTITSYTPGSPTLVLRSTTEAHPLTYAVSSSTTWVDESGAPIAVENIAPGLPVTVQYVREGDRLIASRVVVVREKRKLSDDEKDAIEDIKDAQKDLRKAQRESKEELREKRKD